jgi:putative flippase GtrA
MTEAAFYSMASGLALAVDMSMLWLLVEWLDWHYLLAAAISFLAGTALVYVLSVRFIFRFRRIADPRIEFFSFAAIGVLGLATNLAVLKVAVDLFGVHYMVAKLISVAFTFTMNFGLRRFLLFTSPKKPRKTIPT